MLGDLSNLSKRSHNEPVSEINITPLVDVMLVLLVIFILTAPLLAQVIKVNLPQTARASTAEPATAYLTLFADGHFKLDQSNIAAAKLKAALSERLVNEPELVLRVESDATVPFEQVAQLLAIAKQAGIKRLSIATEAR